MMNETVKRLNILPFDYDLYYMDKMHEKIDCMNYHRMCKKDDINIDLIEAARHSGKSVNIKYMNMNPFHKNRPNNLDDISSAINFSKVLSLSSISKYSAHFSKYCFNILPVIFNFTNVFS